MKDIYAKHKLYLIRITFNDDLKYCWVSIYTQYDETIPILLYNWD